MTSISTHSHDTMASVIYSCEAMGLGTGLDWRRIMTEQVNTIQNGHRSSRRRGFPFSAVLFLSRFFILAEPFPAATVFFPIGILNNTNAHTQIHTQHTVSSTTSYGVIAISNWHRQQRPPRTTHYYNTTRTFTTHMIVLF